MTRGERNVVETGARRLAAPRGPRFDRPIPPGGYHWHYLDGVSDDGSTAIVVIAMLGNPFSPGYASARARGPANALAFAAMNVAIYARGTSTWALQERRIEEPDRSATGVTIGNSSMRWEGDRLVVDLDERASPVARRVQGRVVIHPEASPGVELDIDAEGEHRWWPVAPLARIEVDLPEPGVRFSGHGYHDANAGAHPLESSFERWTWSRARFQDRALLTYDATCATGAQRSHALAIGKSGALQEIESSWRAPLAGTAWGLPREARVDAGASARVVRSLEDGPFYARALVETRLGGHRVIAVHEELAAHRLRSSVVRFLTRFRMRTIP